MDINTLTELVNQNLSSYEIADKLNCSQTNVRHWLKKHGLKTKAKLGRTRLIRTHKVCSKCHVNKSIDEFYKRNDGRIHCWCSECFNKSSGESIKQRRIDRKIKLVQQFGGKCVKCGYSKNYAALNFHHKDPLLKEYKMDSRTVAGTNWETILLEASKCELLCSNCHAEHHNQHLTK